MRGGFNEFVRPRRNDILFVTPLYQMFTVEKPTSAVEFT